MSRELLQQALDALEEGYQTHTPEFKNVITALRAALAAPAPDYNDRLTTALYCGDVGELNRVLAEPADEFEVRADGEKVRKDRWEWGIRRIVALLWGNRPAFEVDEVVDAVRGLVPTPNDEDESLCATVQNNYVAPDVPTPDYIATIDALRAGIVVMEAKCSD